MAISGAFRLFLKVYVAVAVIALLLVLLSRQDFKFQLEPNTLYAGVEGGSHANEIRVAGDKARSIRFYVTMGKLPDGLRLKYVDDAPCAMTEGTPERRGRYYFTIRARNLAFHFSVAKEA